MRIQDLRLSNLVLSLALLAGAAAALASCEGCRPAGPGVAAQPSSPVEPDAGPPTLRLYFVSDLAGALEPCGCTKDQLGGIDKFGAWVRRNGGEGDASRIPSLVAAAGPLFFMDTKLAADHADQDREKATTIARVLHRLDLAAFAPGSNDWDTGRPGLADLARQAGATAIVASPDGAPFATSVVREVGGLKVGFVGYAPAGAAAGASSDASTITPTPEQAVRRGVDEAKRQGANVLVALVAAGRGEAKRIADAVPELTAVVVGSPKADGDANTTAPQGERIGEVLVAQGANHLQSVAVLDLYVRETVEPRRLLKLADATGLELAERREDLTRRVDELHQKIVAWSRDTSVSAADLDARRRDLAALEAERSALDRRPPPPAGSFFRYAVQEIRDSLGKDPAIEGDMTAYYKAVDEHNRAAFADRMPPPRLPDQAAYLGIDVCSTCHVDARKVWNGTAHAHAYATLATQFKEYNLDCVSCHVTGYEKPGGSSVAHVEKLKDVQCEDCHGPGSLHVQDPTDKTRIVARPAPSVCLGCHHPPHVENFDVTVALRGIVGPGHGMPSR
jgi:2',3'-cyclic-nucleotide 2'-phosphodiesterase (5'-nucleotidase family)